jgi:glutaminyl-peptide cyclotransferase
MSSGMKTDFTRYTVILFILFQVSWTSSCSERPGKKAEAVTPAATAIDAAVPVKLIKLISPEENKSFRLKEPIKVVMELADNDKLPDSVMISFDGKAVATLKAAPWEYTIPPVFTVATGRKSIKVTAYKGTQSQNPVTRFMVIFSDIAPKRYGYRVVHIYPHDVEAFTQGLFYDKGVLYEGTGQKSGSSLREVELQSGKVIRQYNLDASLFGEGITLYHDRIYQVTWENKVGFIYDKATFNLINKIYYSTQGWGLTTVNDRIIMSDGSNVLAAYEPEMFTIVSRIEVYDNEKKIDSLNELEYINGEIWANIWMSDLIARIDPVSGKVMAYIDLRGLLPEADRTPETDVLNGIAYDPDGKRIFVTGKRWPKLFEIRLTE